MLAPTDPTSCKDAPEPDGDRSHDEIDKEKKGWDRYQIKLPREEKREGERERKRESLGWRQDESDCVAIDDVW